MKEFNELSTIDFLEILAMFIDFDLNKLGLNLSLFVEGENE